ncbi:ankyrin repeat domain-containing protein 6-like [Ceratina calcarata]|uniref:Ankyrin repeat domain-containing protein 6-like n=1 Tax=Ceratina calcarata TaxID=156304 RepID=A0AAJ7S9Q6_9HYME|nr:ankyrin repeat domain-containing protein 6-like [Ceratina calcarata]
MRTCTISSCPSVMARSSAVSPYYICLHIVEHGADIKLKIQSGETLLHFAAQKGVEEICRLIIERGADVDAKDERGYTALHVAAESGQVRIMEILLNWDVDINTINKDGDTALHLASIACYDKAVRTLIENDCDVNIVNDDHKTALRLYCSKYGSMDRLSMIQELLLKMEKKCIEEIRRMKSTKIKNTVITFHDILTKRIDQIALYARNEDVVQVMEASDYQTMFPTYEDIIKRRFNRGKVRKELLDESVTFFRWYFNRDYDLICIQGILKYLSNLDLTNLRNACKKTLTATSPLFELQQSLMSK